MDGLVSVCVPAYQQPELLKRCLESVLMQDYLPVEVHVTDDSPDEAVQEVVNGFKDKLTVSYQKNSVPLGSPANWNEALGKATGDYVLLLHHDDSFAAPDSLSAFIEPFQKDKTIDFVFGRNLSLDKKAKGKRFRSAFFNRYYTAPDLLLAGNYIGAPSNVVLRAGAVEAYNPRYKWIVDIELYMRLFRKRRRFRYLDRTLVNIGLHEGQISRECVQNFDVQLYEYISVAVGANVHTPSLALFDFYWRLLRNANVTSAAQLPAPELPLEKIPAFIKTIVSWQQKFPASFLRNGVLSKLLMFLLYIAARNKQEA